MNKITKLLGALFLGLHLALASAAGLPVNVLTFGAKCDGSTDDSTVIQKAITASTGDVVLPAATCLVSTGLTAKAGMRLVGSGQNSILKTNATSNFSILSIPAGAHNVVVTGVKFYGNAVGTDPANPVIGVDIGEANSVEVASSFFERLNYGIRVLDATVSSNNATGTNIHDNHFVSAYGPNFGGYGVLHVRSTHTQIHHNIFNPGPFDRHGIYISAGSTFVDVNHNDVGGAGLAPISVNSGTLAGDTLSRIRIHANTVLGSGAAVANAHGISVTGGISNSQITNNSVQSASAHGIFVQAANGAIVPSKLLISGNVVSAAQGIGIEMTDITDSLITGNVLLTNGQNGTDITDIDIANTSATATRNKVVGNLSTSTMRYAVHIGASTTNNSVAQTFSTTMSRNKVQDDGTNTRVEEYQDGWQTASSTAGVLTLDPAAGSNVKVTLTENITSFTLTTYGAHPGQPLNIIFTQDGTGGRTVAFNASLFASAWSDTGNTANKVSSIRFVFDGTKFQQVGAQMAYH